MAAADGTIHLSFPAMQAAEASLTHQLAGLRGRLEQLAGDLQPLVHSWSGEAQAAYVVQKQRWEVPSHYAFGTGSLVPLRAGESLAWKLL